MQKGFTLILIVLVVAIGGYFLYQQQTKSTPVTPFTQTVIQPLPATQTFKSEKGSFAIDLPSDMKMTERSERIENEITMGEVWFTFGQFDENVPSGLVVVYGKPIIDGKGGACSDGKGEGGYKKEMIAGQEVQVCEIDGFDAAYFTHPNKKIEYHLDTSRLSTEQLGTISEAVRKTLRFQ